MQFTENDIEALANVLIENGYSPNNVTVMTQTRGLKEPELFPTEENIFRELDLILDGRDASDSVMLAFTGHGVKFKDETTSYFAPVDVNLSKRQHLVSFEKVYQELRNCPAQRKLLLSDACRNDPLSASAKSSNSITKPANEVPPGSTVALFSCEAGQEAREDETLKHGVFFHFVLEGLRGKADKRDEDIGNGNGTVELTELASYTQKKVPDYVRAKFRSKQTPDLKTNVNNIQLLLRYPLIRVIRKKIVNSLGAKLILLPPGTFRMGSPSNEKGRKAKREFHHSVTMPGRLYMGGTEVTLREILEWLNDPRVSFQADWLRDKPEHIPVHRINGKHELSNDSQFSTSGDQPMTYITRKGASAFCKWLTQKEGVRYRLPTEAEWEYACRAGTETPYSFGSMPDSRQANINNQHEHTLPVRSFPPNAWGFYDMHGNAAEIVQSDGNDVLFRLFSHQRTDLIMEQLTESGAFLEKVPGNVNLAAETLKFTDGSTINIKDPRRDTVLTGWYNDGCCYHHGCALNAAWALRSNFPQAELDVATIDVSDPKERSRTIKEVGRFRAITQNPRLNVPFTTNDKLAKLFTSSPKVVLLERNGDAYIMSGGGDFPRGELAFRAVLILKFRKGDASQWLAKQSPRVWRERYDVSPFDAGRFVMRGGDFTSTTSARSAARSDDISVESGFRVVCELPR